MLRLTIGDDGYNEETQRFELVNTVTLDLEHSLVSLSKWESEFGKPFLTSDQKSSEEILAYLKAMLVTPNVDPNILLRLSPKNVAEIQSYIDSPQSATTFASISNRRGSSEIITSELVYYWMVAFTIPFECQYWHLNRLFALIRICNIKNSKPEEMSRHDIAQRNRAINEKRRAELGTTG